MGGKLRIVVTGGGGFIGSHLVEALLKQGHEVLSVDNYLSGTKARLRQLQSQYPNLEVMRHDVIEPFFVECDQIYHLACPASPVHYQSHPIKTIKTNFLGTLNVLGIARRTGAKVLLASTSEVYGNPSEHPQPESYYGNVNSCGPRSCYDEGKRAAECLCMDYHRQHRIRISIARIFNTYGPGMSALDGRVVSNFIAQALKGESITIYGDGTQTRSFCWVHDLVDGLIRLMNSEEVGPINLGNPVEWTIKAVAELVRDMIDPSLTIVYRGLPADDPVRRKPDITQAMSKLGWKPTKPFEEGLSETIEYFREDLDNSPLVSWSKKNAIYEGLMVPATPPFGPSAALTDAST